jgi:hypothetical protein
MEGKEVVYNGNCHCGSYRFELPLFELKGVTKCNCDLCKKQGYLWLIPPTMKVVHDDGNLVDYHSSALKHKASIFLTLPVFASNITGRLTRISSVQSAELGFWASILRDLFKARWP